MDDNEEKANGTHVLGEETLHAIREDIAKLRLPTWVSPPPKHPGDSKWGKFKAEEWKTFCTINLPITLTRLWGSRPETDRMFLMLKNFLDLVTAVKIADKRSIGELDIQLYEHFMASYLRGLLQLYPDLKLKPYHHLALHIPAHLRRFGPTHAWRCNHFERYNGILQKIKDNNKFGKSPGPIFHTKLTVLWQQASWRLQSLCDFAASRT